jgi:dUTPase
MYYRLELLVEPWAAKYYKNELNRPNENAGYDLYCQETTIPGYSAVGHLVNQGVKARMMAVKGDLPYSEGHYLNANAQLTLEEVHYRLVPRSSIFKTPLSMANSEGIIDRTYRGLLKAPVRNHSPADSYKIEEGTRLFQIVAPDMGWIREVRLVEVLPETVRGEGGFGSTGL